MIDFLEKLISFPTLTRNLDEQYKILSWIDAQLTHVPLIKTEFERNGVPSLLYTTTSTKTPRLWLAAHCDVVPASPDHFHAKREGSHLLGRGVIDMKFAIACYTRLAHELKNELAQYDFGIMITSDEEAGGQNGVGALVEEGYASNIVFLPDGGSVWNMEERAKGMFHFEITSTGTPAHAAKPWEGENPFHNLFVVLQKLQSLFPAEPCGDANHLHSTINIGKMHGGEVGNQVPASASTTIDVRCFANDEQIIRKEMQEIVSGFDKIEMKEMVTGFPYCNDCSNDSFQLFKNLARDMHGIDVGTTVSHGSSDARYFVKKNIPVLLINPTGGDYHCDSEWIDMQDLERYYAILKEWVCVITKKNAVRQ